MVPTMPLIPRKLFALTTCLSYLRAVAYQPTEGMENLQRIEKVGVVDP